MTYRILTRGRLLFPLMLLLCSLAALVGQNPVHQLDLARLPTEIGLLTRISGVAGNSRVGIFGVPVAGGEDLDGDGHNDLALAYMTAGPLQRFGAGEVYLIFGSGSLGQDMVAMPSPRILRIAGLQQMAHCGDSIWMGDFNGDSRGELVIGCQDFSPSGQRQQAGALVLVHGTPLLRQMAVEQQTLDLAAPPGGVEVLRIEGAQAAARLGIWMRNGDVDGDGIDDLVAGADREDDRRGAVYVLRGGSHLSSGGVLDIFPPPQRLQGHVARIHVDGLPAGAHFGATCQSGDLDGNGRAEVLAAATLNRAGASLSGAGLGQGGVLGGASYIVWDESFPAGLWPDDYSFALEEAPGPVSVLNGEGVGVSFGEELLAGADLDGDGAPDLYVGDLAAIGFTGEGWVFFDAASLKGRQIALNAMPPDIRLSRIIGPEGGALGSDTAALGDFDGDGWQDLLIGAPTASVHIDGEERNSAGKVHIFYGQAGAWPSFIDTSPEGLAQLEGLRVTEVLGASGSAAGDRGDTLCYSAAAGDMDGDGLPEALINEMVGNGPGPADIDIGNIIVLGWRTLAPLLTSQAPPTRPVRNLPPRPPRPSPPR
ncbi:MAG TPA: VCBS repeat-containing protein [Acidobacteriota bacterium]|nr:VCBS repeat-containing protein [Acidobacteriota bacterium]